MHYLASLKKELWEFLHSRCLDLDALVALDGLVPPSAGANDELIDATLSHSQDYTS